MDFVPEKVVQNFRNKAVVRYRSESGRRLEAAAMSVSGRHRPKHATHVPVRILPSVQFWTNREVTHVL